MTEEVIKLESLRNMRIYAEYKHCRNSAPGGVVLMPELDNISKFHGVIFVRRGLYRNGIFRFTIEFPKNYSSLNSFPVITFSPPIFNPLIDSSVSFYFLILFFNVLFIIRAIYYKFILDWYIRFES